MWAVGCVGGQLLWGEIFLLPILADEHLEGGNPSIEVHADLLPEEVPVDGVGTGLHRKLDWVVEAADAVRRKKSFCKAHAKAITQIHTVVVVIDTWLRWASAAPLVTLLFLCEEGPNSVEFGCQEGGHSYH